MYFLRPDPSSPRSSAILGPVLPADFPDGPKIDGLAARKLHGLLAAEFGEDFSWHFAGIPEIQWNWKHLREVLERGPGWSFPEPGSKKPGALLLSVQFLNSAGSATEPLQFRARISDSSRDYELVDAIAPPLAPSALRRLAANIRSVLDGHRERIAAEARELEAELAEQTIGRSAASLSQ